MAVSFPSYRLLHLQMVWLIYTAPIKYIIQGIIEILLSMTGFMITSLKQQI